VKLSITHSGRKYQFFLENHLTTIAINDAMIKKITEGTIPITKVVSIVYTTPLA